MFSNFAPQRREAGWGRRRPENPTGFMPVVNPFDDLEPAWAAIDRKTLPVLRRW